MGLIRPPPVVVMYKGPTVEIHRIEIADRLKEMAVRMAIKVIGR